MKGDMQTQDNVHTAAQTQCLSEGCLWLASFPGPVAVQLSEVYVLCGEG